MNENRKKRPIRAGKAFMAACADDPQTQQAVAKAMQRLRAFAVGLKIVNATQREMLETTGQFFAAINRVMQESSGEQGKLVQDTLSELRAEQQQAFGELAKTISDAQREVSADLAAHGFDPPQDLEAWEELARLVEKEPQGMTVAEIYSWAIAWAKRETLRLKIARGETPIQAGDVSPESQRTTPPEDVGIRRDENDARFAWCMGKRIYLGNDSQIGRLFWVLASPIGRARSLAEVQRGVDGFETDRDPDSDNDAFKKAGQRVRKAMSKLREALREAEVDDHLLIVRGGSAENPEYTMVLRYPK